MEKAELMVPEEKHGMRFVLSAEDASRNVAELQKFVQKQMTKDVDYGIIPGTGDKPTLLKPGAEKLAEIYGLAPTIPQMLTCTEDFDKPLFDYTVKVALVRKSDGAVVAEGIGNCNSMESKYRFRWVFKSQLPAHVETKDCLTKDINTRKGPATLYRLENDDIFSLKNTILKMAKKRALIDATLSATRSSGLFTQDIEDLASNGAIYDISDDMPPPKNGVSNDDKSTPASKNGQSNGNGKAYKLTDEQVDKVKELMAEKEISQDLMKAILTYKFNKQSGPELTKKQGDQLIKYLEKNSLEKVVAEIFEDDEAEEKEPVFNG